MSVAIIAALPREIAGLVRGRAADNARRSRKIFLYRVADAVVVAAGMGADRVTLAVQSALDAADVKTLISVGLAGSCQPSVRAGVLVRAAGVIDAKTGERFKTEDASSSAILVSDDKIASKSEKARLHAAYGAAMVDMEAATVGRLASANGLAFQAIKGISDAYDFEMESLSRFADAQGQFQTVSFAIHTAFHPRTWGKAIELGRNSNSALALLTEALRAEIALHRR